MARFVLVIGSIMTTRFFALLAVALSVVGCRSQAPKPKAQPVAVALPRPSASAKKPPAIAEARVTDLVERWRGAQNRSDFEAYRSLYSATFHGVKRAGDKVSSFDRTGWMKDRREMFQRDVKVAVSDLRVFPGERSAVATFVQDWSSASYRDVGAKRLELVLQGDRLLIEGEEMLSSTGQKVVGKKAANPEELALAWPLGTGRGYGVVLQEGSVETKGTARKVSLSEFDGDFLIEKDVTEAALRPFAALEDRQLDLYGTEGVVCSAKVTEFRAVGGFSHWDPNEPPDEVWSAIGSQYVVAVVKPEHCSADPLWARASDLPKPTLLERRDLTDGETELAKLSLSRTAASRATQENYVTYRTEEAGPPVDIAKDSTPGPKGPKRWESLEPKSWSARAFTHPDTKASYFFVELTAGEGCGEFGGYAFGAFKSGSPNWLDLTGDGAPGQSMPERPLFGLVPEVGVVLEPAGRILFVREGMLLSDTGAGFVPVSTIGRMRMSCGC